MGTGHWALDGDWAYQSGTIPFGVAEAERQHYCKGSEPKPELQVKLGMEMKLEEFQE